MGVPATKQNLPPMMLRYLEFKEQYPDALLFFQVGDFYELFYDDAITVAKALNLTLTSRDKNSPNPIPMCGVPLSVLDSYVDRLLPLGYSVAVVSQTGSGQGVERALERFVTPGMRLFTSVLSDAAESLLAAVTIEREGGVAAIAVTDPQTGVIRVKEGLELSVVSRELSGLMVQEVVLPRVVGGDKIDRRTSWVRGIEGAVGQAALRFRGEPVGAVESEKGLSEGVRGELHALSNVAKRAVRLLLTYLDEVSLGNTLPVSEISLFRENGIVTIDAATRSNLELVQNSKDGSSSGTLFGFLNSTETPGGGRLLKSWIVSPLMDVAAIHERLDSVTEIRDYHEHLARILSGLSDVERLAARVQLAIASPRDMAAIRDTVERIPEIQDILAHCKAEPIRRAVDSLHIPQDFRSRLQKALVEQPPAGLNEGGIFQQGYDSELDELLQLRNDGDAWRAAFESNERKSTGIGSLKVKSNNVIGFFIEVPTAHSAKVPEHYQRRQSTANAERFTTAELKQYEDRIITAVDRQVRREQCLFTELRTIVGEHVAALRRIAGSLAELDALAALARAAERNQWTAPVVNDSGVLTIEQGRHPIIEDLLGSGFIPNSVHFTDTSHRCFIVTGPNMGGKSTYLRQIALIVVLAQIGSYVPAAKAVVGIVDRIFARLGAADNLHEGESTFMVEMREAAHILAHVTSRSLVVIDELGRGTATSDGQSLAQAILERLAFEVGSRTLFATHYHELTGLDRMSSRIKNLSVGSVEEEDRIVFTHAIQDGPAPRSYGLEVAKLSGLPTSVLSRAAEILLKQPSRAQAAGGITGPQQVLFEQEPYRQKVALDVRGEKLKAAIDKIDPDALSPREALSVLYDLTKI